MRTDTNTAAGTAGASSIPSGSRTPSRPKRLPWCSADPRNGRSIVHVPLKGGGAAVLWAEDFDALTAAGFTDQWISNSDGKGRSYVRAFAPGMPGGLFTVAVVIMRPSPGYRVRYRDGDRLNLRRGNLYLREGFSTGRADPLFGGGKVNPS